MEKIKLQIEMNGVKRYGKVKNNVSGYKHDNHGVFHTFQRGNVQYMIDCIPETGYCTIEKFNLQTNTRLDITYDDFHKFIDIVQSV